MAKRKLPANAPRIVKKGARCPAGKPHKAVLKGKGGRSTDFCFVTATQARAALERNRKKFA